ncbi:MAG: hypothetical protein SCM57_04345 [Bacillota bacterium]|nr:hypothetical protein [Bacillota bacterium]
MSLYEIIKTQGANRVFILGMAKNAGKTSTLNHLIGASTGFREKLGLTSTGRDGEALDLVTGKIKPYIFCPRGTIIATARNALHVGSASLRDLESTGIDTPLGEVIIAEVAGEGCLELAGPLYARDLERLLARMTARGAKRIFVDGSLDRKAAGSVLQDIVLAVGAVVSAHLDVVVAEAATWVEQLSIPPVPDWVGRLLMKLPPGSGGIVLDSSNVNPFPFQTLLGRGEELASLFCKSSAWGVYIAGALGEDTFRALLAGGNLPRLVVRNATCLFVSAAQWQQFMNRGGEIYATQPLRLLAVTANPYSPEGWEFPLQEFLQALKDALHPVPVMNPGPWVMK